MDGSSSLPSEPRTRLRITSEWNWNPLTWSWYTYEMDVHTIKDGEPVLGRVRWTQRGPYHRTEVSA